MFSALLMTPMHLESCHCSVATIPVGEHMFSDDAAVHICLLTSGSCLTSLWTSKANTNKLRVSNGTRVVLGDTCTTYSCFSVFNSLMASGMVPVSCSV